MTKTSALTAEEYNIKPVTEAVPPSKRDNLPKKKKGIFGKLKKKVNARKEKKQLVVPLDM